MMIPIGSMVDEAPIRYGSKWRIRQFRAKPIGSPSPPQVSEDVLRLRRQHHGGEIWWKSLHPNLWWWWSSSSPSKSSKSSSNPQTQQKFHQAAAAPAGWHLQPCLVGRAALAPHGRALCVGAPGGAAPEAGQGGELCWEGWDELVQTALPSGN